MDPMFTEDTKKAIEFARDEAGRHGHSFIGTEHILLGLIRLDRGRAIEVLTKLGLDLDEFKERIAHAMHPSEDNPAAEQVPLTRQALIALEQSAQEAETRESKDIETEDLLLGLLKHEETLAARVLIEFAIDYYKVLNELRNL